MDVSINRSVSPEDYYYVRSDSGQVGRYSKDIEKRQMEIYKPEEGVWLLADNSRIIRRLKEEGETISYEQFLNHVNGNKNKIE